jgi:hypothetical protein
MGEQYYIHREDERIATRVEETGGRDDWEILGGTDAPKIQILKARRPKIA